MAEKYKVEARIVDFVEHKGWVTRPEAIDTFDIECEEHLQMSTAHKTMHERNPKIFDEHTLNFLILKQP